MQVFESQPQILRRDKEIKLEVSNKMNIPLDGIGRGSLVFQRAECEGVVEERGEDCVKGAAGLETGRKVG